MNRSPLLTATAAAVLTSLTGVVSAGSTTTVTVDPTVTRSIEGISDLDRKKYISMAVSTAGTLNALDEKMFHRYFRDLGIALGRRVNILHSAWAHQDAVHEDPARPGYVDLDRLKSEVQPMTSKWDAELRKIFPDGPDLVATENFLPNTWPPFMETYYRPEDTTQHRPMVKNYDAGAEGMMAYLQYGFDDWNRPRWFEGINEPDWYFNARNDASFFGLHKSYPKYAKKFGMDMRIGGPCFSTAQWFRQNYQLLPKSMGHFIDQTWGTQDFYSFHPYNYMEWNEEKREFEGRITGGLPMDADLDAVVNYTVQHHGKPIGLVISEHGGYMVKSQLGDQQMDRLAKEIFPDLSPWEQEMKRRAFTDYLMVTGAIMHTLSFMDHPHTVEKAIPFILLQTLSWKPDHYAAILASKDFKNPAEQWVETRMVDFYKYFKDVSGRRVAVWSDDPDIQTHAFVNGSTLYLVMNNLALVEQRVDLKLAGAEGVTSALMRRLTRNDDFTPNYQVVRAESLDAVTLAPREAVVMVAEFSKPIEEASHVNETVHYGDKTAVELNGQDVGVFRVEVPDPKSAAYAVLRVAVGRGAGTNHQIAVRLNGQVIEMPLEDAAPYLEYKDTYGALKRARVPLELLRNTNRIEVAFPDGKGGGIGSVVLRVARETDG
ncbi:MAG: hypothetical protein AAF750_00655 [Planctomycetota bacterium]